MKLFYHSKLFWTNVSVVVLSVGSLFTGEETLETALPKLILAGLGILGVVFRWNTSQILGFREKR